MKPHLELVLLEEAMSNPACDWKSDYRRKVMSADEAAALVRSGDRLWVHPGNCTPEPLLEALVRRANVLAAVEMIHMLTLGEARYTRPEYAGSFRHNGLFLGANVRDAAACGRADYTPIALSEIEALMQCGEMPMDVVFLQATPPDAHGYVCLGAGVECTLTAAEHARTVVVEINDHMPRTLGDTFLHVSHVTAIVETSRPLLEMSPAPSSPVAQRIARHVASLVPDGATLQIGIGGIGNEILAALADHRDLGIHSELCPDGAAALVEKGVINGAAKTLHPGKVIAGFVLGSERLFRLIDSNPMFEFHRTQYVNDPYVISRNDKMHAINCAIQVDLSGQICADSIGPRPYSGVGGQPDFMRGAARSRGGKAIIALPATAKKGSVSRIVPALDPGAGVVTPRSDVHYIVTEYGIAYLRGKTLRERAEALIAIADPKFRDWLGEAAAQNGIIETRSALVA